MTTFQLAINNFVFSKSQKVKFKKKYQKNLKRKTFSCEGHNQHNILEVFSTQLLLELSDDASLDCTVWVKKSTAALGMKKKHTTIL